MKIFYRMSDGSYPKIRFDKATKNNCFFNFLREFRDDTIYLFLDNVKEETWKHWYEWAVSLENVHPRRSYGGSSAGGFRIVFEEALDLDPSDMVYFVEDDYIHLLGARKVLLEGLERSPYVTLYNHPDKYIPASKGGNPFIGDDGAEVTKVFVTDSSYWMMTNSTTMTFASHVSVLKEDIDIWKKYTMGTYPFDMQIFLDLRNKGRGLIQPIPTKATHGEPQWAAHLHGTGISNWEEVL